MAALTGDGNLCAWGGCTARFDGIAQPADWATVTIEVPGTSRHAILCPKHAEHLDGLLKAIGGTLDDLLATR